MSGRNIPGGNIPGWNVPGGNFPGGNMSRTVKQMPAYCTGKYIKLALAMLERDKEEIKILFIVIKKITYNGDL